MSLKAQRLTGAFGLFFAKNYPYYKRIKKRLKVILFFRYILSVGRNFFAKAQKKQN